jgi:hypothetical protein
VNDAARLLKANATGTRLTIHRPSRSKKLQEELLSMIAAPLDADSDSLSATTLLLNPKLPWIKEVNGVLNAVRKFWERSTLPYTDADVRLLPTTKVEWFTKQLEHFQAELEGRAAYVQVHRYETLADAQARLGKTFDEAHYPSDFGGAYRIEWSFPSLTPPDYLAQMNPAIYEQEQAKIAAKLEQAMQDFHTAAALELQELVAALAGSLANGADGKRKVLKTATVDNFKEFFARFKELNISSNDALDQVVAQAQELLFGVEAKDLRGKGALLRREMSAGLDAIKKQLPALVVDKKRRSILPSNPVPESNGQAAPQPACAP